MLIRGTTVDMKPYIFTIDDIPIKITEESVALVGKKGTPLLIANTIVRGLDDGSVFEGDLVLDKSLNYLGTVIYRKGFMMYSPKEKGLVSLPDKSEVVFESDLRVKLEGVEGFSVEPVMWVYNEQVVLIRHIVIGANGKICTTANMNRKVSTRKFKLYTGINVDGRHLCYGDTYLGGIIELHNYKPMIRKLNNEYIEIEEV